MKLAKLFALAFAFLAFLPSSGKAEIVGMVETGLFYRMESGDNPWKLFQRFNGRPTMAAVRKAVLNPNRIRNPRRIPIGAILFIAAENLQDEFANLIRENRNLKNEASDLREVNNTLKQEVKNLREENESLRAESNSEKEKNAHLAAALKNTQSEVSALQQGVRDLQNSNLLLEKKLHFAYALIVLLLLIILAGISLMIWKIVTTRRKYIDFGINLPQGQKAKYRFFLDEKFHGDRKVLVNSLKGATQACLKRDIYRAAEVLLVEKYLREGKLGRIE